MKKSRIVFITVLMSVGLSFSTLSRADTPNPNDPQGDNCPLSAQYQVTTIKPVDTQKLLQCRNSVGSTYFAQLGDVSVDEDNLSWMKTTYPDAWLCMGTEVEDCKYHTQ